MFQGYLEAAPLGLDVRYAWTLPGGHGENVRIADIEFSWNLSHNDLAAAASKLFLYVKGATPADRAVEEANRNHGTAVIGELVAAPDGIGVTGIAHGAKLGLVNPLTGAVPDVAGAIRRAASEMRAGDVMLIEEQSTVGPRFDLSTGRGLLPVEYETQIFQAIKSATSKGIVVVESAGNGFDDLDHPAYNGAFDRNKKDSGAIMVGAGLPEGGVYGFGPDRTRTPESNYGSRVDVQGWGRFITTTGFGDLRHELGENNWYTIDFGATSGAAAMVAGAAALIQSILIERGREPLEPADLRQLLVCAGTPQTGNLSERIGPRPNLRAALALLDGLAPEVVPEITAIKLKKSGGKLVVDGSGFVDDDSIIEIDGTPVTRLKYPSDFATACGTTGRIQTKANVTDLIPRGADVSITVFTPSTSKRSAPFIFRRN
ncbi:MAG TPA: S8 family serine peptidase [Blastocatellia bacterium]|nr:S8 family serine peptidase [Blastocatellia bacterium]